MAAKTAIINEAKMMMNPIIPIGGSTFLAIKWKIGKPNPYKPLIMIAQHFMFFNAFTDNSVNTVFSSMYRKRLKA